MVPPFLNATETLGAVGWKSESITWLHSKKGGRRGQAQDETLTELMSPADGVGGSALTPMRDPSCEGQRLEPGCWPLPGTVAASPAPEPGSLGPDLSISLGCDIWRWRGERGPSWGGTTTIYPHLLRPISEQAHCCLLPPGAASLLHARPWDGVNAAPRNHPPF